MVSRRILLAAMSAAVLGLAVSTAAALEAQADKVLVCHRAGPTKVIQINVDDDAVPAHLGHGDAVGACDGGDPT
jgi:hypothetical protein